MKVLVVLTPEEVAKLFNVSMDRVDCAGLKLTLSKVFRISGMGYLGISNRELPKYDEVPEREGWFKLGPGPYLVKYNEYIKIPNGYIGLAIQRSSLLRMGVSLYTAVWDPGYEGRGSGLLVVHNPNGIMLQRGVQVAQLVIIKMSGTTVKLYRGAYLRET